MSSIHVTEYAPQLAEVIGLPYDLVTGDPAYAARIDMETLGFGSSATMLRHRLSPTEPRTSEFDTIASALEARGRQIQLVRVNERELTPNYTVLADKAPEIAHELASGLSVPMWYSLKPGSERAVTPMLRRVGGFGRFPLHQLSSREHEEDDGV